MFKFFEPGVAAVAVASAAVCGRRTKREKEREKERKGTNFFFKERFKKKEGLRLKRRKEKKETRYARGRWWTWVDGSGWMDIWVSTSGGRGDDRE